MLSVEVICHGGTMRKTFMLPRPLMLLLSTLLLCGVMTFAQKKYLVSPNDEVIPLRPGESAAAEIAKRNGQASSSTSHTCGYHLTFGFDPKNYPLTANFGIQHK